ncbi:MAG: adenine methylase [Halanaerobiales bacterium]|nr:adenine methylase [Halanaerobiales bacterium]
MLKEKMDAKPILKWAGGKRQLLDQFEEKYPAALKQNKIKKYVEPFVGGGAVFFELASRFNFEEIVLNDINEELILTYKVVKSNVEQLIKKLKELENKFIPLDMKGRKEIYYEVRTKFNEEKKHLNYAQLTENAIDHAGHLIFLNRTCFNGLYRQNRQGEFNVPIGRYKNPTICDEDNLRAANILLRKAKLLCDDYKETEEYIDETTFVYLDPPYRPLNKTSSFTSYSKADFGEKDQIELAKWFRKLDSKPEKPFLMLSNSNPKNVNPDDNFFEEHYRGFKIDEVFATRAINSKASKRGSISELVIRNY